MGYAMKFTVESKHAEKELTTITKAKLDEQITKRIPCSQTGNIIRT